MLHLAATKTLSAISIDEIAQLVPALLAECREIRFEGGVCRDRDHVRREGLRVIQGSHPYPGCRYQLAVRVSAPPTLTEDERAELRQIVRHSGRGRAARAAREEYRNKMQELLSSHPKATKVKRYEIELLHDEPHRFEIRLSDRSSGLVTEMVVNDPARHPEIRVTSHGMFTGGWPRRGEFRASGTCDLGKIPAKHSLRSQIEGDFEHRRLRADGHMHIGENGDRWEARIRIRIGGRGLLIRPAAAALALIAGSRARRAFRQSVQNGPDITAELRNQLDQARLETGDSDQSQSTQYARTILDGYMNTIVEADSGPTA